MVIKIDCPWCDHSVQDDTYPPSAGHSRASKKLEEHFISNHPEKQKQYEKIREIWNEKNLDYGSIVNFYIQIFKDQIDDIDFSGQPPRTIVKEYDPSQLKDLSRTELRKRFEKHVN